MRASRHAIVALTAAALTAIGLAGGSVLSREIGFEERLRAQEAIERVYHSHLEGSRRPFEQAVTRDLLERRVRTYLKESAALEEYWNTPITAEMLRRESERISGSTRFPDRLEEIRVLPNHDIVLFQETLVQAVLVNRLARSFLRDDDRIHQAGRASPASGGIIPRRGFQGAAPRRTRRQGRPTITSSNRSTGDTRVSALPGGEARSASDPETPVTESP